eukprot:CAMPEP_0197565008 /NCGR_PEP_ID=MMETSP1320-20131121/31405_1 /TAXON_ID=91990 /ORGANISM="Bolidomonas sp., Strain RCC2347" /LENGTH=67 /DNA_ID=CAMNT_0043126961 /DNA_START=6 /DNA_END=206 /DNA_ORIENTATION=+
MKPSSTYEQMMARLDRVEAILAMNSDNPLPTAVKNLEATLSSYPTSSDPSFKALWDSIDALHSSLPS